MWQLCSCRVQFLTALHLSLWLFFSSSLCCSVDIPGSGTDPEYSLYSSLLRIFIIQMFLLISVYSHSSTTWLLAAHTENSLSLPLSLTDSSSHSPFSLYLLFICHVFCIQTIPDIFIWDILYVTIWACLFIKAIGVGDRH